jgi:UDP-3-O-[3-hydroxymyristoyl] glucosamine N-acyltransferase
MHVQELARRLGARVDANADLDVTGVASLEEAGPRDVAFLANARYHRKLGDTRAGAILVAPEVEVPVPAVLLRIPNPYLAFARALEVFHPPPPRTPGVHPAAAVDETAAIGRDVSIGAYAVVGRGARIGDGTVIHPHAVVYDEAVVGEDCVLHANAVVRERCVLGRRVVLQNGVVVGADGFGFAPGEGGRWTKIPQVGIVVVDDDVEIQANACVDRPSVGTTRIGRGTKIDNLVQVGHGCRVGEDALLCGQVGLAGSTEVGNRAILGGQVGVGGHVRIGDGVSVAAQTGIHTDLADGKQYGGSPAQPLREYMASASAYARLPDILRRLRALEKTLGSGGAGGTDT